MANPCASILRPRRCVCLPPASFERPVSDRPPRRPLCDCYKHAQNFMAIMASMTRVERHLCHPWTTKATFRPPLCLERRPGQCCGRTSEAQRSQPLCKMGFIDTYVRHTASMSWTPHLVLRLWVRNQLCIINFKSMSCVYHGKDRISMILFTGGSHEQTSSQLIAQVKV